MSLPKGDEKAYLEVTPVQGGGFTIEAEGPHAGELQALFRQHGIACTLHPDATAGKDELTFTREVEAAQLQEILDGYKTAKGS
jgi:hypothetical protein